MQLIGLARLGRDAAVRDVGDNTVANFAVAFDYYDPKADTKRSTTWVDCALWGKQATSLQPYLKKGQMVCLTVDDLHTEEWQSERGSGTKLMGRVTSIKLAGSKQDASSSAPAPTPAPKPRQPPAPAPTAAPAASSGFDEMDDDIPF